jgi:2-C-methyl-D-erythritol 2,4-cyclodiphosphate synthase
VRVGIGYDSHQFAPGRRLVLAGVVIPHPMGLAGHSDADAAAHAVTDAVLGAAALGDMGTHFPPHDETWRDADSMVLLERAVALAADAGYRPVNVDITIVCEEPAIGPHRVAMRARLAGALGIDPGGVSVKGKSNEGMGWIGRGEGVAALAVATLARR